MKLQARQKAGSQTETNKKIHVMTSEQLKNEILNQSKLNHTQSNIEKVTMKLQASQKAGSQTETNKKIHVMTSIKQTM